MLCTEETTPNQGPYKHLVLRSLGHPPETKNSSVTAANNNSTSTSSTSMTHAQSTSPPPPCRICTSLNDMNHNTMSASQLSSKDFTHMMTGIMSVLDPPVHVGKLMTDFEAARLMLEQACSAGDSYNASVGKNKCR